MAAVPRAVHLSGCEWMIVDMDHVCDPTLDHSSDDNPLTRSRVLRLVMAQLDAGIDLVDSVTLLLKEIGGCTRCLTAMLLMTAGLTCEIIPEAVRPEVISQLDTQLAAALDQIADENSR